jgi:hypothetical protein
LNQLSQIDHRISELSTTIAHVRREIATLGRPEATYQQVRESWSEAKQKRTGLIAHQCEVLTQRSQGEIRAFIRSGVGVEPVLQTLRTAVSGLGFVAGR